MKISLETDINNKLAAPMLDRMLTRIVALLEKGTGLKFDVKADGNTVRLAHKARLLRKRASQVESVAYNATENGYTVFALDVNGQIIGESSQDGGGYSRESNLVTAEKAARKWAEDLGIESRYVYEEPDIEIAVK
jgi:predicted Rdx family selenoprotein